MNYRLIRSHSGGRDRMRLALILAALGSLILFHTFFPSVLGSLAASIARPLWTAEGAILERLQSVPRFFTSKKSLIDEVARLQEELAAAELLLLDRDALEEENRLLKEQFGRTGLPQNGILAAVLALPPRSPYDTVVLDAGSTLGVTDGAVVFAGPVALGTIARVHARSSVAELYSTPGRKTPMSLRHNGVSIPIEAEGQGGGAFTAVLPKEAAVSAGDSVYLAGLHPMLFGTVDSIDTTVTGSFQTLYIQSPVTLSELRFVEIAPAPAL